MNASPAVKSSSTFTVINRLTDSPAAMLPSSQRTLEPLIVPPLLADCAVTSPGSSRGTLRFCSVTSPILPTPISNVTNSPGNTICLSVAIVRATESVWLYKVDGFVP